MTDSKAHSLRNVIDRELDMIISLQRRLADQGLGVPNHRPDAVREGEGCQMSAVRLVECLAAVRWTQGDLARAIGEDKQQVRRWISGTYAIPRHVGDWIERLARFHRANPAPCGRSSRQ